VLIRKMWFVPGSWGDQYRAEVGVLLDRMATALEAARAQGELRADADTTLAARAIYSCYFTTLILHLHDPVLDPKVLLEELGGHLAQLMRGLGPEPG
jgi:hypothetical protein